MSINNSFTESKRPDVVVVSSCLAANKEAFDGKSPDEAVTMIYEKTGEEISKRQLRERVWERMPEDIRPNIRFQTRGRRNQDGNRRRPTASVVIAKALLEWITNREIHDPYWSWLHDIANKK